MRLKQLIENIRLAILERQVYKELKHATDFDFVYGLAKPVTILHQFITSRALLTQDALIISPNEKAREALMRSSDNQLLFLTYDNDRGDIFLSVSPLRQPDGVSMPYSVAGTSIHPRRLKLNAMLREFVCGFLEDSLYTLYIRNTELIVRKAHDNFDKMEHL